MPLFLLLQSCENDDSDIPKSTRYTIKYNCSENDVRKAIFPYVSDLSYNYYEVKIDIQEYDVNNNIIKVNTMETPAYYDDAYNKFQKVTAKESFQSLTNTTHLAVRITYFFYNKYSESSKRLVGTETAFVENVFYLYGVDDIIYIDSNTPFSSHNPVSGHL